MFGLDGQRLWRGWRGTKEMIYHWEIDVVHAGIQAVGRLDGQTYLPCDNTSGCCISSLLWSCLGTCLGTCLDTCFFLSFGFAALQLWTRNANVGSLQFLGSLLSTRYVWDLRVHLENLPFESG